jgi:threonylcarbamoyladenosine tRNA methylthiotransferase MtaB
MTSFAIQNFGCRVNQAEAFDWTEALEGRGLELEPDAGRADIVVINTCTLTSRADRDVRKFVRRVSRLNPEARLVVAGCSVTRERASLEAMSRAWMMISNEEKCDLPARVAAGLGAAPAAAAKPLRSRALLKIQDGCDLGCSFCVIPQVRGASRSVGPTEVLGRAGELAARGFREIVLCGIHLSSYGLDLRPPSSLAGLLRDLTALVGPARVRLSSLDPRRLDEDLLELVTGDPGICPHFHISLQHASASILRRMGRAANASSYAEVLDRLKRRRPEAALGADIIVGFPGESEAEFSELREFLESSPLTYFHVFVFSPRPGTPAAGWAQVRDADKRRRSAALRQLSARKRLAFQRSFLGRELDGVVVRKSGASARVLTGNYIDVRVSGCARPAGEAVRVRIDKVDPAGVSGMAVG